jgi:type I restriction enzyme S subunit
MSFERTLGNIAEIVMGQSPAGDTCNDIGNGIPLLNGPTEFGLKHPIPVQFTTDPKKLALPNDLLFCVRGSTTGRMNWSDREYAIGRGLAAIRGKEGYPNSFVRSVIEVNLDALLIQATGSTFPNVSRDLISSLVIPNASQKIAKVTASVVEPLDDRIALLCETNATLQSIAQTLFKSWFVDFDPVRAKSEGRFPEGMDTATAALFPDEFEATELGMTPKGWSIKTLGYVTERITKGTTPTTLKRPFVASGINFVKAESMTGDGGFVQNKFAFIDDDTHQLLNRSQLKAGDILISIAGTIGRVAVMTDEFLPANTNQAVAILRPNPKVFPGELINRYLRLEATQRAMSEKVVQAVQANLSLGTLSGLKLCIPPEKDIEKIFNSGFAQIEKSWSANDQRVSTLSNLRNTLLPRLISGQLRIADAEAELEKVTA